MIPSHGGYPADAETQLKRRGRRRLADLKVVGRRQQATSSDHELYGVIDPDKAEVGTKGVGTLIAMQDAKGNDLVRHDRRQGSGRRDEPALRPQAEAGPWSMSRRST